MRKQPNLSIDYTTATYSADRRALGETNDCAVISVTILTGLPYAEVHAMFRRYGRQDRKGTFFYTTCQVLNALGYEVRTWSAAEMIAMLQSYPAKGKQYITTHHPKRFRKQWAKAPANLLFRIKGHILACKNHQVHDWTEGRSFEVKQVIEVTKR